MRVTLFELVLTFCGEYQGVEKVRLELSEEFENVDLVLAEVRQTVDHFGRRLQALLTTFKGPTETPMPTEEVLENIRDRLEHVFMYWRRIY